MAHKNSINMTNLQREGSSGEGEGGGKEEIAVKRRRRAGDKRGSARLPGDCLCVCLCCPLGHCLAHVRAYCFCCLLLGSALIVGYKFYHYQRRKINLCAALWICVNLHNATNTRTNKIRTHTHTHTYSLEYLPYAVEMYFIAYFCAF